VSTACAERLSRRLYQIAPGPFQSRIGRQFRRPKSVPSRPIKPRGFRTSHEPRYIFTTSVVADIARRQLRFAATPDPLGGSEPPEHHCWSQAPENRRSSASPERTFRRSGRGDAFLGSRQFRHHLILPHGHPYHVSGSMLCLRVTYAITPWRQAKVCLRPLSSYGEDRASRPPPLQHRVPILSLASPLGVGLIQIAPGLFRSQVRPPFRSERKRRVLLEWSCFSLTASRTFV